MHSLRRIRVDRLFKHFGRGNIGFGCSRLNIMAGGLARNFSAVEETRPEGQGSNQAIRDTEVARTAKTNDGSYTVEQSTEDLHQICEILEIPYTPINHELKVNGQVKLIDEDQKRFLGIFSLKEAIAQANSMGKEVVMSNARATPPICKLVHHRSQLYERFVKEVILAGTDDTSKAKRRIKGKTVMLRPKMTLNDLNNKVRQTLELAEKNELVKVIMSMKKDSEDKGRNLFQNFIEEATKVMDMVSAPAEVKDANKDEGKVLLIVRWPKRSR